MKFTIIIPAYNSSTFIYIPLDSLEKQLYGKPFQVLIIDDGSTDNLKDVVGPFLKRNKTWELIKKQNGNWGSVINYVKQKNIIKGEYVTILDSDDYFKPEMLSFVSHYNEDVIITGISKLENNKQKRMPIFFNKKDKIIKKERAFTPISTPHGKFYKTQLFSKMVDLEEGIPYQDTVLFNDLISKSNQVRFLGANLAVWWRDREGNSTTQEWSEARAKLWLETCSRIVSLPYVNDEANSWALMYLWELQRHYKQKIPFTINIDIAKAKFKWLPFGVRNLAKMYFRLKTKKYRK